MRPFAYHRPDTVDAAGALIAANTEARFLAGGMSMLPALKLRLDAPEAVVDLAGIAGLAGITPGRGTITIGAMTRHVDVACSDVVLALLPGLARLAGGIGDPAVRNRGTIGGSLANNDPAADYPAAVLALGATIHTNRREIKAADFFRGLFKTALAPGEVITAVRLPLPVAAAYAKFKSPASRFALVGVFVARFADGARVAVTGAAPMVFRAAALEKALSAEFAPSVLAGIKIDAAGLNSDLHADAEYRAHLVVVMARRAVALANELASQRS